MYRFQSKNTILGAPTNPPIQVFTKIAEKDISFFFSQSKTEKCEKYC
jgi:hypothetical protein